MNTLKTIQQIYTVSRVLEEYDVGATTVKAACRNGWIPAIKYGDVWLMHEADVVKRWGYKRKEVLNE